MGTEGRRYSDREVAYFSEIAFGSEFGTPAEEGRVKKWTQSLVRVWASDTTSEEAMRELASVIEEINALTGEATKLRLEKRWRVGGPHPNVIVRLVPRARFMREVPSRAQLGDAYFAVRSDSAHAIRSATIYVVVEELAAEHEARTSHLLREELTQVLGLMQDSYRYEESVFYQGYSETTAYARIDRALIEMLYRPDVRPGMTREEAVSALSAVRER